MGPMKTPGTDAKRTVHVDTGTDRITIDLSEERHIDVIGSTTAGDERRYILKVTRKQALTLV